MESRSDDTAAIRAVVDRIFASYHADIEEMLSCYAPDLVTMMPFGEPTYGLVPWREILEGAFERSDIIDIDYDIEEILILGDWAWEWHNQWSTQRLKATDEVRTLYIRAAQLFQRQHDGEWKVARYIGNAIPLDGDIEEHKKMIRTAKS